MQRFKSHKPYNRPMTMTPNTVIGSIKEMCLMLIRIEVKYPATGKDVTSSWRCLNDQKLSFQRIYKHI